VECGRIKIPDFKFYHRAMKVKKKKKNYGTSTKNRHEDHWSRIKDPDTNPCVYTDLILTKAPKMYCGGKTAFSTNVSRETGSAYRKLK
jgi:hypothetical protein